MIVFYFVYLNPSMLIGSRAVAVVVVEPYYMGARAKCPVIVCLVVQSVAWPPWPAVWIATSQTTQIMPWLHTSVSCHICIMV